MRDRIPANPGRVLITPETGAAYYATLSRADNPVQEGDALNKQNLLPDEVAEKLGLDPAVNPVPADGFEYIATNGLLLNLTVHGGTSAPNDPKEGDIWVNTDTPITSWAYSVDKPENPTEGKIWLKGGGSTNFVIDTGTKGNIKIFPGSAAQYINGAWTNKTAKSYQNGVWIEWITLLIDGADECESVTGGWESLAVNIADTGTSTKALNVEHGTDYIELTGAGGGMGGMYATKNKIDCTGKTALKITGEINAYNQRVVVAIMSSLTSSGVVAKWTAPASAATTLYTYNDDAILELPAGLTGEYYIAFGIYSTDDQYIRLSKVYLE